MEADTPDSGWALVAEHEQAAKLIAALLELEAGATYARSEIADVADVPLKTLYLEDTLDQFVRVGLLERADGEDDEECFTVRGDSEAMEAARTFEEAVAESDPVEAGDPL